MPVKEPAKEAVPSQPTAPAEGGDTRTDACDTPAPGLTWAPQPTALETQKLTKHYPVPKQKAKRIAVDNLDLSVSCGEIFGFLGPNGAGKTTTIKMLLGFTRPTSGTASLFGHPIDDDSARAFVGYVPEQPYFPKFLTVQEVVRAHASLSGVPFAQMKQRTEASLNSVRMYEHRYTPLSKLSKGMTQRVGLATALIGDPKLLILDEPSSGLDPVGRKELRDLLQELKDEGKTIFLSSHLLSEMESMCDRVGILSQGKLVACGKPAEIVQSHDEVAVNIEMKTQDRALKEQVAEWGGRIVKSAEPNVQRVFVPSAQIYRLVNLLEQRCLSMISVTPQRETLEDAFLRLVGEDQAQ
jgi:ABC-2 type transport system ATP-binding protein